MADVSPLKGKTAPEKSSTPRAPRRIVRLTGDEQSEVAEVLRKYEGADVSGKRLHEDVRTFADAQPGEQIAAEWLGPLGWTRFLWCKR